MKFIDPRIDFAFRKIFGSEDAKDILISFLESLLGLEGERRIAELTLLDPFLAPKIKELKYSILDVKCRDHRDVVYIVEMQIQRVAAFLKRIQYNAAKTYVHQIERGDDYPQLNQVIAITISDFVVFEQFGHWVSRHEYRETVSGASCLQEIVHYFIELPKFTKSVEDLEGVLDQWIWFIRYAGSLEKVPKRMQTAAPLRHAFEKARLANMSREELELYESAGVALADARGAVEQARMDGEARGEARGRRQAAIDLLRLLLRQRFGPGLPTVVEERLARASPVELERWTGRILTAVSLDGLFDGAD
ncbi:MAG: Rpn family recombination-promoting nuclease/putative transposase [Magnetococcales bacterium]|nr:Rpn family recombination-promoting nuclease/putative transposase [Magnetococcales bacterium]